MRPRRSVRLRQSHPTVPITIALLVVVMAANIYRAATQSIVYDEAVTYLSFVRGPLTNAFTAYNPNNHVLFTVLAAGTTRAFGVSELVLRLPTLLAAAGYLIVVFALARLLCGQGPLLVPTAGALALNPLVLDFLSAARGYGLALFFFVLALFEVQRALAPAQSRPHHWIVASLALGASVCANLAFLFPALGLLIAASLCTLVRPASQLSPRTMLVLLWMPGALFSAAMLAVPLRHAHARDFTFGANSLVETLSSLVTLSLRHHPTAWTGTAGARWLEHAVTLTVAVAVPLMLIRACFEIRRMHQTKNISWPVLLAAAWTFTLCLLAAAHMVFDVPYPAERTGLYFIPLFILASVAVALSIQRVWATRLAGALLLVLISTSIEQFTVRSYGSWRYDAGSRAIAQLIASSAKIDGMKVAASEWLYQPALEYYRTVRFRDRLAPVSDGFDPARIDEFDFLVLNEEDAAAMRHSWRLVYTHPVSRAQVFANPRLVAE